MGNLQWSEVAHMYADIEVGSSSFGKMHSSIIDRGGNCLAIPYEKVEGWPLKRLVKIGQYRPILRHLQDMTEGEARELRPIFAYDRTIEETQWNTYLDWWGSFRRVHLGKNGLEVIPKAFHWLLSKGFDIFGLIESGQAIRKEATNA